MGQPYFGLNTNQNPDGSIIVPPPPPTPPVIPPPPIITAPEKKPQKKKAIVKKGDAYKDMDLDALNAFADDFMDQPPTD